MTYTIVIVALVMIAFSLPGMVLSHMLWKEKSTLSENIIFGSVIGFALS